MFTHGLLHRRAAWMRRMAVSLTLALGFAPLVTFLPAAQAQGTVPTASSVKSILLFPTSAATDAGAGAAALTTELDDAIKLRLSMVGDYTVMSYTKFLPSVQRALSESANGGLTDADVQAPFDHTNGQKVARLVGTDAFLINTITSYTQDPATRRVTIGVGSRVFYSRTGDPVPGLGGGFSGEAGPTSANDTDSDIQQGAINDVAARIASSLNAAAPHAPVVVHTSQRGSSVGARNILATVLIVALATAILSGSHFGGGGGSSSSSSSSNSGGSTGSTGSTGSIPGPPAPPSAP